MQIEEVIREAEREAASTADELNRLRVEMVSLQERYERAARDLALLKEISARYGGSEDSLLPLPVQEGDTAPWSLLNRQQAVLRAMREIDRPVRLPEIVAHLQGRGRNNENVHLVSATLAALKRKGSVQSAERGVWEVSASSTAELLPVCGPAADRTADPEEDTG